MRLLCSWMCRAHCHRVIKLSGTIDQVAPEKELIENVHGVRKSFLNTGATLRQKMLNCSDKNILQVFSADSDPKMYFIGKLLWSKGLGSLMELLKYAEESANLRVKLDVYGSGPDKDAAEAKALKLGLEMPFHGPLDHAELSYTHKVCRIMEMLRQV
jgi:digalactosyldiacylglycerol synthase